MKKRTSWQEMKVYLNGEQLGSISNNEIKVYEIPAEKHCLKAKIDSQGSKTYRFFVTKAENKTFVIATNNKVNAPEPLVSGQIAGFHYYPVTVDALLCYRV